MACGGIRGHRHRRPWPDRDRGHHGGREDLQQDFALYHFGGGISIGDDMLDQLQLAPTILRRLGVPIPDTMKAMPFLS